MMTTPVNSDIEVLSTLPSSRLTDIITKLDNSEPTVINLDAMIPKGRLGAQVLKTFLYRMKPSVITLSLRFNTLAPEAVDELVNWLPLNETLLTLYLMGTGIDGNNRMKLETCWKRFHTGHYIDNSGYSFFRKIAEVVEEEKDTD